MKKEDNKKEEIIDKNIDIDNISIDSDDVVLVKKDGFNLLEVILIMLITLFFGAILGSAISYATSTKKTETVVENTIPSELKEFVTTYNDIVNNYYQDLDSSALLDAGIEGMLDFLGDKYSVYMNNAETQAFNQEVEGKYVGIGTEISLHYLDLEDSDNYEIILSNPFENSSAYAAGIRKGDILLKVNDEDIKGLSLTEVSSMIKGEIGTTVKITVQRENEELEFNVIRNEVEIESVSSNIIENNNRKIGYIKIDIFAANTTNQFEKQLIKLESQNIDSLVIDVRNNSGGYLSTVTDIASMFLDKSKAIYQLDTKGIVETIYSKTSKSRSYPIIMLINKNSASASEILTGAMLESYGASVIGTSSYGKGTVQKAYQLESGATVKYTIQKWLTPNGNWINEQGITPTTFVEDNSETEADEQLDAAIAEFLEK